jgi:hypothetical protein
MVRAAVDADRADLCRPEKAARLQPTVHRRGARIHCRGLGNLRGVIKELDRLYAGLGEHLEEETAFVIDGAIHETAYSRPIRPGFKVFFIPKIEEIGAHLAGAAV